MANLIDILINAKWGGEKAVRQAEGDLRDLGKAAPKTGLGLAGLASSMFAVTAAVGGATVAFKKMYAAIGEGAEIELTRQRFDRLAVALGTTSEALGTDIRIASQGMLSDMEAMALATDFLSLGLAKSHDEAVRLSSVASQLGFDMNQLVLTLTNQTTMRFDALGIAVDGFSGKVAKLEASGLAADEAFKFAFIEQAEEQIERLGSRAETTAGQLDILGAAWANTKDELKLAILQGFAPVIESASEGVSAMNTLETSAQKAAQNIGDLAKQKEAVDSFREALVELRGEAERGTTYKAQGDAIVALAASLAASGETVEEQQAILEDFGFTFEETFLGTSILLEGYRTSWNGVTEAVHNIILEQQAYNDLVRRSHDYTLGSVQSTEELSEEMEDLGKKVAKIRLKELIDDAGLTSEEFTLLSYSMGGAAEATEYLKKQIDDGKKSNEAYAGSLQGMIDKLLEFTDSALEAMAPLLEERAELFRDFQLDLSDISQTEGENRASAEAQYEERRTDIVEQYGERRAQAEEDYQRRQVRNAAKLAGDIEDAQENSYERQAEIRENANQRFADLERDHADRLTDIIRNADDSLTEAAGRLDASAIVSITRRRERALEDEEQAYQRSHENIQRTLDEQLSAEQAASISRIADMQEYFAERQALDEEDHQLRLDRLEDANKDQLAVLEEKNAQELIEIQNAASLAQGLREIAYFQERTALGDHLGDKAKQEAQLQKDLLIAEEKWWKERTALIPDTSGAASLPDQFFAGAGPSQLELNAPINIYIDGADGPEATGLSVRDELLGLFGSFTQ